MNTAKQTHRRIMGKAYNAVLTDPYSRHVRMMGECLMRGKAYHMFTEEPEHCAQSLLVTYELLMKARKELLKLHTK